MKSKNHLTLAAAAVGLILPVSLTGCIEKSKAETKKVTKRVGMVVGIKPEFLFDNQKDPYQMHPIVRGGDYDDTFDELKAVLKTYLVQTGDPWKEDL